MVAVAFSALLLTIGEVEVRQHHIQSADPATNDPIFCSCTREKFMQYTIRVTLPVINLAAYVSPLFITNNIDTCA